MKKIVVVYWSGTGNTGTMADAVAEGAKAAGCEAKVLEVGKARLEDVLSADGFALGCPAMGAEVLEEGEMEPFVTELLRNKADGKACALFGSYDWGDGQWMRDWAERMKSGGFSLIGEGLTVQLAPDEAGLEACRDLGRKLAAG